MRPGCQLFTFFISWYESEHLESHSGSPPQQDELNLYRNSTLGPRREERESVWESVYIHLGGSFEFCMSNQVREIALEGYRRGESMHRHQWVGCQ